MKNNIFGYVFVLFIIVIMGFAIYRVKIQNGDKNTENGSSGTSSNQEIQKGKEAKAKELGDRIRKTPSRIIEGVKDKAKNTLDVGKSFVKGITGIEREVDDDDGR